MRSGRVTGKAALGVARWVGENHSQFGGISTILP